VPILFEWRRTGVFAWSFQRETPASFDGWVTGTLIIAAFACMALYYMLPLVLRMPSPGTCIMGYQIVADDGRALTPREALRRLYFGFKALSFRTPSRPRDKVNGKFWLDEKFGTRAVKLL